MLPSDLVARFWAKVDKKCDDECWEWTAAIDKGYGQIGYKDKTISSHRLSYMIHNNIEIAPGMFILHSCNNRKCCNPYHLREGTHKENMKDMANSNVLKGERNPRAKLTMDDISTIRSRYENEKITYTQLAKEYNVSAPLIHYVVKNRIWTMNPSGRFNL